MAESLAEVASRVALERVFAALDEGRSFRLEAGAGAGKTYSLIKALERLIEVHHRDMPQRGQQIACITYTNVAREEIQARIDNNPIICCETNHAFCWSLISGFQQQMRELIKEIPAWQERMEEVGDLGSRRVEYSIGRRAIRDEVISLHHDDVLPLTIALMENEKFRHIMTSRYPIILIDEYQDTDAAWVEAIKKHFLGSDRSPIFGFFGDHWQKIYPGGCGKLEHPLVEEIGKGANFRSVQVIVDKLNAMRPELPQFVDDPEAVGEVRVFLTNDWAGARKTGGHWGGDLPTEEAHAALDAVRARLEESDWDIQPSSTKILMLTHRGLALEQGYPSLPEVFRYNEAFTDKDHPYISYLVDVLDPACDAFEQKKYGEMFELLGSKVPLMKRISDKAAWSNAMASVVALRDKGTIGQVISHLMASRQPRLPEVIERKEKELVDFVEGGEGELPPALEEIQKLRSVAYDELRHLRRYLDGTSPFETKHGVKGAQFENVLVVLGRGWNRYNFNEMLELASGAIPANKVDAYERNRNLFYVASSRPKKRLALLFTQKITPAAETTLRRWFGNESVESVPL